jgi:hypothetical protein
MARLNGIYHAPTTPARDGGDVRWGFREGDARTQVVAIAQGVGYISLFL